MFFSFERDKLFFGSKSIETSNPAKSNIGIRDREEGCRLHRQQQHEDRKNLVKQTTPSDPALRQRE
jgi:hypothetical protein